MRRRRPILPLLCLLACLGAVVPHGAQAEDPPENPFAALAANLRFGPSVRTRGAIVLPVRLAPAAQPSLVARVGLAGSDAEILPLPGPAGRWHVRIANREDVPLLVPAGETLLTPLQPSRSVDRPVWLLPGSAAFVPVVQRAGVVPAGPYVSRPQGLTPVELALIRPDRWTQRVRLRNRRLGVPVPRQDDAGAGYATPAFAEVEKRYLAELNGVVAHPSVVGVIVCDDRGPYFAHIQTDRARFRAHWPTLRSGIVLDAAMLEASGAAPRPGNEPELRNRAKILLRTLGARPLNRSTFGEGWEYRWNLTDPTGFWHGHAVPAGPVSLTLHLDATRPAGARPSTGPNDPPERTPVPGIFEGARRVRPSEFEKRLEERRRGLIPRTPAGGGATRTPTPGGGGGGRAPAAPTPPARTPDDFPRR